MAAIANKRTIEAEIIDQLSRTRDETEHRQRLDSGQDVL